MLARFKAGNGNRMVLVMGQAYVNGVHRIFAAEEILNTCVNFRSQTLPLGDFVRHPIGSAFVDINTSDNPEGTKPLLPQLLETAMDMNSHHAPATDECDFKSIHCQIASLAKPPSRQKV